MLTGYLRSLDGIWFLFLGLSNLLTAKPGGCCAPACPSWAPEASRGSLVGETASYSKVKRLERKTKWFWTMWRLRPYHHLWLPQLLSMFLLWNGGVFRIRVMFSMPENECPKTKQITFQVFPNLIQQEGLTFVSDSVQALWQTNIARRCLHFL